MVQLVAFKGVFDFINQTSRYKTDLLIGGTEVVLKTCPQTADFSLEAEASQWKLGYSHHAKLLTGKKKWKVGKNNTLIVRQDVPKLNFAVIPSPEIQLENVVHNAYGLDKNKLELKYDTFWKTTAVEEQASFGGRFTLKIAADSNTKLDGAKIALKTEVRDRLLDEIELSYSKSNQLGVACKLKPLEGSTLKAKAQFVRKSVACNIEYEFKKDGLEIELVSSVVNGKWSCPVLGVGFKF